MIKFFKNMLSEGNEVSCMRFMSLVSLFIGAGVAYASIFQGCKMADATTVIGIFVGAAFGGKVGQKYVESKGNTDAK